MEIFYDVHVNLVGFISPLLHFHGSLLRFFLLIFLSYLKLQAIDQLHLLYGRIV